MTGQRRMMAVPWLFLAAAGAVSAQTPPSQAAARVVELAGSVSVLKDSYPIVLNEGSWILPKQEIVTGPDGYAKLQVLADGSTFEVFQNSDVIFHKTPGNLTDLLDLVLGRVKVHIQKLTGGAPNPNRVHTPTALISVRGTIFDVVMEDTTTTLVAVDEGTVAVRHLILPPFSEKEVHAGESLRVFQNQPLAKANVGKSGVIHALKNAASDLLYTIYNNGGRLPGSGGGAPGGGTTGPKLPGDTTGTPPPPPPPNNGGSGGTTTPPPPPPGK
jgi:ferric-dicitrate binding protein FerR (iron transport regulator)